MLIMKNLIFLIVLIFFSACGKNDSSSENKPVATPEETPAPTTHDPLKYVELITPANETVRSSIAATPSEQSKGLQGVRDADFDSDEGKLFFYLSYSSRVFWMPNTYFNLDIIYLDAALKITDIVWNMPHYTGSVNSEIPRAPSITSRHVLEMKAGSAISSKLQIGDSFQWKSPLTLQEIELKIRQLP